jgi:hypothetical protein
MIAGHVVSALCILCLTTLQSAWAQPAAPASKPETPPAPEVYEDRLIEGGGLSPIGEAGEDIPYDATGIPRYWRVEAVTSNINQGGIVSHENGFRLAGRIDTTDYGALTLDGTVRIRPGSGIVTLAQRGMAFDGGWLANNGLGTLYTPAIDLSRSQYRFYIPTFPVRGAATEWLRSGELQLQASGGEPGIFDGIRLSGFEPLHGSLFTAGAQWNPTPQWQTGVQFADARNVQLGPGASSPSQTISAQAAYAAAAWQNQDTRLQANVLDSSVSGGRDSFGFWLDGATRQDRFRHNYGVFRLEPGQYWGYNSVASDLQGAYYRINYQDQRWQWDGGADWVRSVSGNGPSGTYLTGNVRYQVDRSLGIGSGATVRHAGSNGASTFVFAEKRTSFGSSRLELDWAYEESVARNTQLVYDQTYPVPEGSRLATTVTLGRGSATGGAGAIQAFAGENFNSASLSVYGSGDITANFSLDGIVRVGQVRNSVTATGVDANISLNWRLSSRWSLVGTYYNNRDKVPQPLTIDPLIPVTTAVPTILSRAVFLTLRYEDRAGTLSVPLGGAPGGAAGTIVGYLFLDARDTGRRDASDVGAPNVTVLLDGLYSTRTDAQGKFEFALVAAGKHMLTIVPDNLPLPWYVSNNGKVEVSVRTRETTTIDIGASRRR